MTGLGPATAAAGSLAQHKLTVANQTGKTDSRRLIITFESGPEQPVISVSTRDSTACTCVLSDQSRCAWPDGLASGTSTQVMTVEVRHLSTGAATAPSTVRVYADDLLIDSGATRTALV